MHREQIELWQHQHVFNPDKSAAEKRTLAVVTITFAMMIVEIIVGWLTNSMALFADGWHMGTHAFALGVSLLAFVLARRHSRDNRFVFGTWKIEILGAYTSAVILGIVGILMTWASVQRILSPVPIDYGQAIAVAILGLVVNVACAVILGYRGGNDHHAAVPGNTHSDHAEHAQHEGEHHHPHAEHTPHEDEHHHPHAEHTPHEDEHHHPHADHPQHEEVAHAHHAPSRPATSHLGHTHDDLNLKSAYLHVVADATTSILAIAALLGVRQFGLLWLDPMMGIVGAGLILRWSYLLLRDTSGILLDLAHGADASLVEHVKAHIESDGDSQVSDLHLWKVGQDSYACIVSLVTGTAQTTEEYKVRLGKHGELAHVTIEVNRSQSAA
jgi:cation diffusion facilitator family transporter